MYHSVGDRVFFHNPEQSLKKWYGVVLSVSFVAYGGVNYEVKFDGMERPLLYSNYPESEHYPYGQHLIHASDEEPKEPSWVL
jgi:hypothetical protein